MITLKSDNYVFRVVEGFGGHGKIHDKVVISM